MIRRIPSYSVFAVIQDKEIELRVPADRVDLLTNIFIFNGVQRLEMVLEADENA